MKLHHGMPFEFYNLRGMIFGGPYREYVQGTRRLIGIKMAREIEHPHDVSIPTKDFSVPNVKDMQEGMKEALIALYDGCDVYVGCMGGVGRTGLFMGCMAKLLMDVGGLPADTDPVAYVRSKYKSHAIETDEQQEYVRTFDTGLVVAEVMHLTSPKVVEVEIVKVLTPLQWAYGWFFGKGA